MTSALIWKLILSTTFVDGTYWKFMLLSYPRFQGIAELAGISADSWIHNTSLVKTLNPAQAYFHSTQAIEVLAIALTVGSVITEGAIAITMFASPDSRIGRWRHVTLWIFLWTVYLMSGIVGFGFLLCLMGLAQCTDDHPRAKFIYLGTILLLVIYKKAFVFDAIIRFFG